MSMCNVPDKWGERPRPEYGDRMETACQQDTGSVLDTGRPSSGVHMDSADTQQRILTHQDSRTVAML